MNDAGAIRAMMLYDSGRYELAEKEARNCLAERPDDPEAHALLALCCLKREDYTTAIQQAAEAVRLGPALAYAHYVRGHVLLATNRHDSALRSANVALELDPASPAHWGLVASVHLGESRWQEALDASERGLERDAEDVDCNNIRAMALVKLGRRAEAGATIHETLRLAPEDAGTHANLGWALLHEGKPDEAMGHFREALRLDPTLEWARQGIVEALKARHVVYRWMLAYMLWMSGLSQRAQWGIILGAWLGMQIVKRVGQNAPALAPVANAALIAYVIFVAMTWLADPLFNLLLRLNRFGRLALSSEQIVAANWIGATLLLAVVCVISAPITGWGVLVSAALVFGLLTLPLAGVFPLEKGWPRLAMAGLVVGLLGLGLAHLWREAQMGGLGGGVSREDWDAHQLLGMYGTGILLATIAGNLLRGVRVKKG